jgi:hypothetical protein
MTRCEQRPDVVIFRRELDLVLLHVTELMTVLVVVYYKSKARAKETVIRPHIGPGKRA